MPTSAMVALAVACGTRAPAAPDLAIVGESTRYRLGDALPAQSPWFDGKTVTLEADVGEPIGIQVVHANAAQPISLAFSAAGVAVRAFAVTAFPVVAASTAMYGPTHGTGRYADGLAAQPGGTVATNPAYFELTASAPGTHAGTLSVGAARYPVVFTVHPTTLAAPPPAVWAYEDPREFAWAAHAAPAGRPGDPASPSSSELACIALFHRYGVALSPGLSPDAYPARAASLADFPYIPVDLTDDPTKIADQARAMIALTRDSGKLAFAIPIDEPHDAAARANVVALATAVHAAGGGPKAFLFAVTDSPHPDYGSAIDLYISAAAAHLTGDAYPRWTYNGSEPAAGSMLLDATTPGTRTWGWIMARYAIPVWYVWDALYWHDRHNRKRTHQPLPGPDLDLATDARSFDDGEDHGNLDGVLALPTSTGECAPTLRLAALRRGQLDRALIAVASRCHPTETAALVARIIPKALGDTTAGAAAAWPTDEASWEIARRNLLALADCK